MSRAARNTDIGPFLKWAGGKHRLLKQFQPFFPETLEERGYIEPFLGSGAVFFYIVQHLKPARCTLLDANPELINLFQHVQMHLDLLLPLLTRHRDIHNADGITEENRREYYLSIRAEQHAPDSPESAARFLYLNKTCFNGLHRLNRQGKFNVPMGRYRQPKIFDEAHLRAVSALLQPVTLLTCPFQRCSDLIQENDFLYLDPPYEPISRTSSFTGYAREGFTQDDQRHLADLMAEQSHRCHWLLSNSTSPLIKELYTRSDWRHEQVMAGRAINVKGSGRQKIPELLVMNYRPASPLI